MDLFIVEFIHYSIVSTEILITDLPGYALHTITHVCPKFMSCARASSRGLGHCQLCYDGIGFVCVGVCSSCIVYDHIHCLEVESQITSNFNFAFHFLIAALI